MSRKKHQKRLWDLYSRHKQTYFEIAEQQKKSIKWVQKTLDFCDISIPVIPPGDTILVIDTTYFGRSFGVMVFRCALRKKNLFWKFMDYETTDEYVSGIQYLLEQGWNIRAIVADGRRGISQAFPSIPFQMCQFHQVQIVIRYVTRRPKLPAGKALKKLILLLTQTDKESFTFWLSEWHREWKDFLNEKVFDQEKKKYRFVHTRLRSAYRSLTTNLPSLFTWYDHFSLKIPNTTNSLDGGTFSFLKEKVRIHRGLSQKRKMKLINALLSFSQPQKKFH